MICNVRFTIGCRRIFRLQGTIRDIAMELQLSLESARDGMSANRENSAPSIPVGSKHLSLCDSFWLRRMLFPIEKDAAKRKTLPSGKSRPAWFRKDLNYEQKVGKFLIVLQNHQRLAFIICHPMPSTRAHCCLGQREPSARLGCTRR